MGALGTTNSAVDLVPGDPADIYQCEAELRAYGDALQSAGEGLQRIDTTSGWSGAAADAFREKSSLPSVNVLATLSACDGTCRTVCNGSA